MKDFKEKVRELLIEQNMTQKDLCDEIDISEVTLIRYFNGERNPVTEVLANMATALHTTVDYLIGKTEDPRYVDLYSKQLCRDAERMNKEEINLLIKELRNLKNKK